MKELLEYGVTGILALVIVAILAPAVRGLLAEMRASRIERGQMRQEYRDFVVNHVDHSTRAMEQVNDSLIAICRQLNDGEKNP